MLLVCGFNGSRLITLVLRTLMLAEGGNYGGFAGMIISFVERIFCIGLNYMLLPDATGRIEVSVGYALAPLALLRGCEMRRVTSVYPL